MITLVPAILSRDPDEVWEKLEFLEEIPKVTDVHLDFADGRFVPNTTAMPKELPRLRTRLQVEAHLMVANPQGYFHNLEAIGVQSVYLHYESFARVDDLLAALSNAKIMGFKVGTVLNPGTDLDVVGRFINEVDQVLLMNIHPGFQGQPFLPESLERLQTLRRSYPEAIIEVDGAVKLDNFETVAAHGASRIVVGSGIWQTPDAAKTIGTFLDKLK